MSHAYTEYMHENQFNLKSQRFHNITDTISGVGQAIMNLDLGGVVSSVFNGLTSYGDQQVPIAQAKLSGYQLTGQGSNALHDIQFLGGMQVAHQQYLPEYMQQIGYYFHRFGYAQNKIMTPNINSRKYFNYLKGEIVLRGTNVPPEYLSELTQSFLTGATIWHMDVTGNYIGNYLPDNTEV